MDGLQTSTTQPDLRAQFSTDSKPNWAPKPPSRLKRLYRKWRWMSLFVFLPTILTAVYFYGFAADQYESEARFVVRGQQSSAGTLTGIGQFLGMGGGLSNAQAESYSVDDYLDSHDAVAALNGDDALIKMFRRPEADVVSRLWWEDPSAETLLKYYRHMVSINYRDDTGITRLSVKAFRPEDAKAIATQLLELGEKRVNSMNDRALNETVRVAQLEVDKTEKRVSDAQAALTAFRLKQQDINPEKTSAAQLLLVSRLQEQLAQARAQQATMGASLRADSPQAVTMQNRIRALDQQVVSESSKLTGANNAMAPVLSDYEQLTLRREFAHTSYTSALASLETARQQVLKQQLFVVRVVDPNLPERALFPTSSTIVASVFLCLICAYAIGWLMLAGVREHAA